ncbi:MAG: SagB/ThcOx family dehydrogenase [Dehalococcoidia bacterium]
MSNRDVSVSQSYHESTKLAYINLSNKPPLYKTYSGVPKISLPDDFPELQASALAAVSGSGSTAAAALDLAELAQLLYFSAGVIRKGVFPSAGELHFRAAASAGGLYPVETYLVCRDIPGLEAGVYHFSPSDFSLDQLRAGDYRGELARAAAGVAAVAGAAAIFVFSSFFWRSSWKYRTRGYRYCFWDNGTVAANLLASAAAAGLPAQLMAGFIDGRVNQLIGIDGQREASVCLVPVGPGDGSPPVARPSYLPPITARAVDTAPGEIDYPEIRQTHAATLLNTEDEVAAWRQPWTGTNPPASGESYPLLAPANGRLDPMALGETIRQRGSTRRFAREPISFASFSAMLDCATLGVSSDYLASSASLLDLYLIVHEVEDLPAGSYYFSRERAQLELLQPGDFREEAGHLGFEQALPADASAVAFFMADLDRVLEQFGNRGYRTAQLEAGILGGRLYLCAHALGLGASGLTFYDEDVTNFFSPHARGKSAMFVVPLGRTGRPNRVRPFRSKIAITLDSLSRGAARQ